MIEQNFSELRDILSKKYVLYSGFNCFIKIRPYNSGRIFMTLHNVEDGRQVARVTLDIDVIPHIPNLIIVKDYAENQGMYQALLKANVIKTREREYVLTENSKALICFLELS